MPLASSVAPFHCSSIRLGVAAQRDGLGIDRIRRHRLNRPLAHPGDRIAGGRASRADADSTIGQCASREGTQPKPGRWFSGRSARSRPATARDLSG